MGQPDLFTDPDAPPVIHQAAEVWSDKGKRVVKVACGLTLTDKNFPENATAWPSKVTCPECKGPTHAPAQP